MEVEHARRSLAGALDSQLETEALDGSTFGLSKLGGAENVVELGKYDGLVGCSDSTARDGGVLQGRCQPSSWLGGTPDPGDRGDAVSMQPKSANKGERQTSTRSTFIAGVLWLGPPR